MGQLLGFNAKLYRLTSGSRAAWPGSGAPSNLDEITNVRELTLNRSAAEADTTTRGSGGYRVTTPTLIDASVEWEMVYDLADTDFTALMTAFNNRTSIALAILDGDKATVGTQGLWADMGVFGFEKTENLEGVQMVRVSVKPTYSSVPPAWITVGA